MNESKGEVVPVSVAVSRRQRFLGWLVDKLDGPQILSTDLADYDLPDGRCIPPAARSSRMVVSSAEGARYVPQDFVGIKNPEEHVVSELDAALSASIPEGERAFREAAARRRAARQRYDSD